MTTARVSTEVWATSKRSAGVGHRLAGGGALGQALLVERHVVPAGEQVELVPRAFAVAEDDEGAGHRPMVGGDNPRVADAGPPDSVRRSRSPHSETMIERLASASVNHRYRTIVVWIARIVGVVVLGGMVTSSADINDRLDGTDSQRAYDLAAAHMPSVTGLSTTVVFKTNDLASTAAVVDEIRALPRIDHVDSPIDHPEQVGPGGISFAAVSFMRNGPPTEEDTAAAITKIAAAHQSPDLEIALGGEPFVNGDVPATEGIGLAAAVVILLIAFGSVVAMGLADHQRADRHRSVAQRDPARSRAVLPTADFTSTVAAMIGLGVGIDYALFMVTRYRAELAAGRDVNGAIAAAVRTSGRAIVFAGGTVVVSLLGLLLIGMDFLKGFAVASSLTVAIAVAAAITLVPALLAVIGRRINRLSIHRRGHTTTNRDNLGRRWARAHPAPSGDCGGRRWRGVAAGRAARVRDAPRRLRRGQ